MMDDSHLFAFACGVFVGICIMAILVGLLFDRKRKTTEYESWKHKKR